LPKDYIPSKFEDFAALFGPGDVPGYLTDGDIAAINNLSKKLPTSGTIVEVGSFLGKSAVEWAKNLPTYKIICIDSFNAPLDVLGQLLTEADFVMPEGPKNNVELFRHYTKNYPNIKSVTAFFNKKFVFPATVDLVFEDSTHSLEYLSHALPFWWDHVNTGGIMAGHDYSDEVAAAVDIFAALNDLQVNTFDNSSIWWMEKIITC